MQTDLLCCLCRNVLFLEASTPSLILLYCPYYLLFSVLIKTGLNGHHNMSSFMQSQVVHMQCLCLALATKGGKHFVLTNQTQLVM